MMTIRKLSVKERSEFYNVDNVGLNVARATHGERESPPHCPEFTRARESAEQQNAEYRALIIFAQSLPYYRMYEA